MRDPPLPAALVRKTKRPRFERPLSLEENTGAALLPPPQIPNQSEAGDSLIYVKKSASRPIAILNLHKDCPCCFLKGIKSSFTLNLAPAANLLGLFQCPPVFPATGLSKNKTPALLCANHDGQHTCISRMSQGADRRQNYWSGTRRGGSRRISPSCQSFCAKTWCQSAS